MHDPAPLTRERALKQWSTFLPKVPSYSRTRNSVQPRHPNVSRLGAAMRFRLVLEDEIIEQSLAHYPIIQCEKWLQEICWRRYWKGWLEMRPDMWRQWRRRVDWLRENLPEDRLARAKSVEAGQSGVACMDAMARELIETGYLHNHARMWWASFWIHAEHLPWELGADFFFRHLLDADPASNTLSWRWVAGLQTPGKTYLVRLSNIEKYAPAYLEGHGAGNSRLADGTVTSATVADSIEIKKQPLPKYASNFTKINGRTGLWLHPDDLVPEVGPLASLSPATIAACLSRGIYRKKYHLSDLRISSLHTVLNDGLERASAHFGCSSVTMEGDDPVNELCQWAVKHELSEIVALAPTVGPIHDLLPRLKRHLSMLGIRLSLIRRASDDTVFSFATAGFFPFWQKMKGHLSQLHES